MGIHFGRFIASYTQQNKEDVSLALACSRQSQGSEFERVLLILSDRDIPLITRELIYTGITRTRKDVDIWAGEDLLKNAISRRISRQSGLTDILQKSPERNIV